MPNAKSSADRSKKQFSARNHSRSASYGRNLNKLGKLEEIGSKHPGLNRSKSAEGISRTKNRSLTKLTALTRTRSYQMPSVHAVKSPENDANQNNEVDEVDEVDEFEDVAQQEDRHVPAQDDEEDGANFSGEEEPQHEHPQEEIKILSYQTPSQFSHLKSFTSQSVPKHLQVDILKPIIPEGFKENDENDTIRQDGFESQPKPDLVRQPSHYFVASHPVEEAQPAEGAQNVEEEEEQEEEPVSAHGGGLQASRDPDLQDPDPQDPDHKQPDPQDPDPRDSKAPKDPKAHKNSEYLQDMILSQSTGLVKTFGDLPYINSMVNVSSGPVAGKNAVHNQHVLNNTTTAATATTASSSNLNHRAALMNDYIGNGSHLAHTPKNSLTSLRQFTFPSNQHSPQDHHSILSFKQRESTLNLSRGIKDLNISSSLSNSNLNNNFSQFLKSNNSNLETRTQQKLWLQRENSLMDVTGAANSSTQTPSVSLQTRRDFEKISRELTNIRRFNNNPLLDSIKRTSQQDDAMKAVNSSTRLENTQLFKSKLERKNKQIQHKLVKLWIAQDSSGNPASTTNSATTTPNPSQSHHHHHHHHHHGPAPASSASTSNLPMLNTQTMNPLSNYNLAAISPIAPTTRAVDRASHVDSPEIRKIDLASASAL